MTFPKIFKTNAPHTSGPDVPKGSSNSGGAVTAGGAGMAAVVGSAVATAGTGAAGALQVASAGAMALENSMTMTALSAIAQAAATQAAVLKISNDLNDAAVSFMKNVGSSVKSAAQ